jgi:hypothetical protein
MPNMTIKEVAEATGADPKTIRAYLRRNFTRPDDAKGSRWGDAKKGHVLPAPVTAALVEHFTPAEEEDEAEAV